MIDRRRLYLEYEQTSTYQYCIKVLGLSEATTCNFINVARKAREVPELKAQIKQGSLTVSTARKLVPVLTNENKTVWFEQAKTLPKAALEREVARVAPKTLTPEKARYVAEDRISLTLGVSEATMKKLKRVQDLVSRKLGRSATFEDALEAIVADYTHRNDPVERASRATSRSASQSPVSRPVPRQAKRVDHSGIPTTRHIPAAIKHAVTARDQGRCTHTHPKTGSRCTNTRFTEIQHVQPLAMGGAHTAENLTTLCSTHHQHLHEQMLLI